LASAPAVAVLGLSLAWQALRGGRALREWPVLAALFVLGLAPYLHIVWTDTHRDAAMNYNYLKHVDQVLFPETGVPTGAFASPAYRLGWLVLGRNEIPGVHSPFHAWNTLRTLVWSTPLVLLFELGPPAALLAIRGFLAFRREDRGEADRIAWLAAASLAFSVAVTSGPLLGLFLLFALGPVGLLAARGLEAWLPDRARRTWPWLLPLAAAGVMLVPHALRLWSYDHPIGPKRWTVLDEDTSRQLRLLRRFDGPYDARDYGLGALRAIPDRALVMGGWRELPILYYFQRVLGERRDLTLKPHVEMSYRTWAREHALSERPIVFLTLPDSTRDHLASVDSLAVTPGRWIYVTREAPLEADGGRVAR
jgi:hypothetical protein